MTVKVTKPALNLREELSSLKKPSGVAGEAMLRAETPQEQFNLIGAGRKNLIINGGFDVWQRGTSFSSPNNYTADRWTASDQNGTATVSYYDDAGVNTLKFDQTVASTNYLPNIVHKLEFPKRYSGKTVTLSIRAKASKEVALSTFFYSTTAGTYSPYTAIGSVNTNYTTLTYTITIPDLSSEAGNSIDIYIGLPMNDTYTVYFDYVQLELGSVATPFEHRSYGEELALCQRYYYRVIPLSATNGTYLSSHEYIGATNCRLHVPFPTTMRTTPTISSGGWTDGTPSTQGITPNGVDFYHSSYFRMYVINGSSTAYINADAEL